jgi:hypothetical protein
MANWLSSIGNFIGDMIEDLFKSLGAFFFDDDPPPNAT